jgi:hypothetical protein
MCAASYTKRVVSEVLVSLGQTRPFRVGAIAREALSEMRNAACTGAANRQQFSQGNLCFVFV